MTAPAEMEVLARQFFCLRISGVVPYRVAIELSVSLDCTVIPTHPDGIGQAVRVDVMTGVEPSELSGTISTFPAVNVFELTLCRTVASALYFCAMEAHVSPV